MPSLLAPPQPSEPPPTSGGRGFTRARPSSSTNSPGNSQSATFRGRWAWIHAQLGRNLALPQRFAWILVVLGLLFPLAHADTPHAKLEVRGINLLRNRQLEVTLRQLLATKKPPPTFTASFIEDAGLLLLNRLQADGYLHAQVQAVITTTNDESITYNWKQASDIFVRGPLAARKVRFNVRRGLLYYYASLNFTGLHALAVSDARDFFYKTEALIALKSLRPFSLSKLGRSLSNLRETLENDGYRDVKVTVGQTNFNNLTGAVQVSLRVHEGKLYRVRKVEVDIAASPNGQPAETSTRTINRTDSPLWEQDFIQSLLNRQYQLGYPKATAHLTTAHRQETDNAVLVDLRAEVNRGPQIQLGKVLFQGQHRTRLWYLRSRTHLRGPLLNRVAVDQARERLARLGIFNTVDTEYVPAGTNRENVVFSLKEGKSTDLSLLFGYGSYDEAFGGFELVQHNLFGIGHYSRLEAVQSMKTSRATYTYTVPEFPTADADVYLSGNFLQRQEVNFTRKETTATFGVREFFPAVSQQLGLSYSYQFLNAASAPVFFNSPTGTVEAGVIGANWQLERRDNALLPRHGYNVVLATEFAKPFMGGQADYYRVQINAGYHHPLWHGGYGHVGFTHGVALPLSDGESGLPFNKRFFPGGENTVRGYQEGEASPRDASGNLVGAESEMIWNLELEQLITPTISFVTFVDGAGVAALLTDYPFNEVLWSAGLGLSWNTLVGPIRLEYGFNLNPRPGDPSGTLHFSLGYPF